MDTERERGGGQRASCTLWGTNSGLFPQHLLAWEPRPSPSHRWARSYTWSCTGTQHPLLRAPWGQRQHRSPKAWGHRAKATPLTPPTELHRRGDFGLPSREEVFRALCQACGRDAAPRAPQHSLGWTGAPWPPGGARGEGRKGERDQGVITTRGLTTSHIKEKMHQSAQLSEHSSGTTYLTEKRFQKTLFSASFSSAKRNLPKGKQRFLWVP